MKQFFLTQEGKQCDKDVALGFHDKCSCNMLFEVIADKMPSVTHMVFREHDQGKKNYAEMVAEFLEYMSYNWVLDKGIVSQVVGDPKIVKCLHDIALDVGPNQIPVPPPFQGTLPAETAYVLNPAILEPYKQLDVKYFRGYFGLHIDYNWCRKNIWKEVNENSTLYPGLAWSAPSDSLVIAAMRESSFYNRAFAGTEIEVDGKKIKFKYNCYAQEDLYPYKLAKVIKKYNKPTHLMPVLMKQNKQLLAIGMEMLAEAAGWDKIFGTVSWNYEKAVSECLKVSFDASAGGRPGPNTWDIEVGSKEKIEVIKHVGVRGKKLEQIQYASRVIDAAVNKFNETGVLELPTSYNKVVVKSEVHHANDNSLKELERVRDKAREFFIPDLVTILVSQLVQGYRQKIERGKIIAIGRDWHHGGMEDFAKDMLYDDPEMRWVTFDISGYDTSVVKIFLELYSRYARMYMKFDTKLDKELFLAFLDYSTKNLTTKIVQMVGNIWRVVEGVMPSGAYETSHGDSWITALVYYCMIAYYYTTDSEFKKVYTANKKRIKLAVYGDDNVFGFPKQLQKWFTKLNIEAFFFNFANFTIRDFEIHKQFLSVPDGRGNLLHKGVVFLQKYAIRLPVKFNYPGMPEIVHFRPLATNMKKFAKGSGDFRTGLDYFLSALTGVYDNPFNQPWYEACAHFYQAFKQPDGWEKDVKQLLREKGGYVTKMLRKMNMNPNVLFEGFPTPTAIVNISIRNPDKHINHMKDEWTMDLADLGGLDGF